MKIPTPSRLASFKAFLIPLALAAVAAVAPLGYSQTASNLQNQEQYEQLSPEALDELVAPFALYPDALIALILPASTVPSDITLASRYLAGGGDNFENQSWDDSVISLARYPEVVTWMDENLAWTTAVGSAFLAQPVDVMNSVQRLRVAAEAAGNLDDTPEQRVVREVVEETTYIRILPAQPNVIYVPTYDPGVVYYARQPDYLGNIISFGAGFAVGSWLNYDCDWGRRGIYRGNYNPGWNQYGGGGGGNENIVQNNTEVNVTNITNTSANLWQPANNSRRQLSQRKDTYNQRVRAANQEVRAAKRNTNGQPNRIGRQIEALPQPEPLVANGKKGKNRAVRTLEESSADTTGKRASKTGAVDSGNEVLPGVPDAVTRSSDTLNRQGKTKTKGEAPTVAPDVNGSKTSKAKSEKNSPSSDQRANKKATKTAQQPTSAPDEKRAMKKQDQPKSAKKNNSEKKQQKVSAQQSSEAKSDKKKKKKDK